MAREAAGQTLSPTALVHEAYLRLLKGDTRWENRRHFFGAAAEAMRRILVERARRKRRFRHGGHLEQAPFEESEIAARQKSDDVLALDEALGKLERYHPRKANIVKLRYFGGLDNQETAELIGVSLATVKSDWAFARAWLQREIRRLTPPPCRSTGETRDHAAG